MTLLPGSYDLSRLKSMLLRSGLQIKDPILYQVIDSIINFVNNNFDITAVKIEDTADIIGNTDISKSGYWTPLILDGEDNGDSEMIITDNNAPIAIWNPTP